MQTLKRIAAIYCRLSREDGDGESSSISSQKEFLTEYAKKNNYAIYDTYVDDGFTGTDFNRPGFTRMIKDIEAKKVNAVIVKDLSRLGRNYLKTGYYIEEYFPKNDVKFISVNDNYISGESENEFAPFKNIMNEWYAKDISKKIKVSHKLKQEKGAIPTGKLPLYGYKYDEKRNRVPCKETADVVKYIFESFVEGNSITVIATNLKKKKIVIPGYWYYLNYNYSANKYATFTNEEKIAWNRGMVSKILSNEEYNGDLRLRKTYKASFKIHKNIRTDIDNVLVFKKKFQPILDDDLIEKVRQRQDIKIRSKISPDLARYKGICFCKNCGKPLTFRKYNNEYYYLCHNDTCNHKAFLNQKVLDKVVHKEITDINDTFSKNKKLISNYANNYIANKSFVEVEASPEEINKIEERNKKLDVLISKLMESSLDGTLPKSTYQRMLEKYTNEQKDNDNRINYLNTKTINNIPDDKNIKKNVDEFFSSINCISHQEELKFQDVQAIFNKINISESKKDLEIKFTYNKINNFIEGFKKDVFNK